MARSKVMSARKGKCGQVVTISLTCCCAGVVSDATAQALVDVARAAIEARLELEVIGTETSVNDGGARG